MAWQGASRLLTGSKLFCARELIAHWQSESVRGSVHTSEMWWSNETRWRRGTKGSRELQRDVRERSARVSLCFAVKWFYWCTSGMVPLSQSVTSACCGSGRNLSSGSLRAARDDSSAGAHQDNVAPYFERPQWPDAQICCSFPSEFPSRTRLWRLVYGVCTNIFLKLLKKKQSQKTRLQMPKKKPQIVQNLTIAF